MRTPAWLGLALVVMISSAAAQSSASASTDELPTLNHFDPAVLDRNLDPCVDFYKFVCSKWQVANPIPPDQANWDTGSTLNLWNESMLRNTMARAANPTPERSSVDQKIGDYWYSCMNEAVIEKSGLAPLKPELDHIGALKDKSQIAEVLAHIHMKMPNSWAGGDNETIAPIFGFSSTIDYNNAKL